MSDTASAERRLTGHNKEAPYDVHAVRRDFPILSREVYGKPLVYLDSAASAQKPKAVLEAMREVYEEKYANVHRGVHYLSQRATDLFEEGREKAARFINAASSDEIVFTRNATEAINLVAASYGRHFLKQGDEIVLSCMEHHSNIVPWQFVAEEKGLKLRVAPIDDDGNLLMDEFAALLGPRTRMVAITHMSNALGTITPAEEIVRLARDHDALVLFDGCQAITHLPVDVRALGADFYVFSGHKLYGPTGIGVLWGREELLNAMPPYQGGGEMIASVTFEKTTYKDAPHRFEAGTPAIVEAVGIGAAMDYVESIGRESITAYEAGVVAYARERLAEVPGLRFIGNARNQASIVSFVMDVAHAHDIGTIVDRAGVAVRAGHHCAQPLMDRFGVAATTRASFGLYNTHEEVDTLVEALATVREIFG